MSLTRSDVNYVYQSYLGRDPDEGAIADLVGQDIDRSQLAKTILQSDEYKSLTPEDQITRQYQNVLGRGPSEDELQRVMGMDDYFNYEPMTMGSRERAQRLDFRPSVLRNDLMKLPEANLVRVFKNYLGRLPDEEAYRNYLSQFEAEPPKGLDVIGQKSRREQKLVDTNYEYAMDPKRIEEVGWSPEAQQYINSKFDEQARAYAAEKGIELPEDFSALAQLRNPYQDNRAGMEGLNLMKPIGFTSGPFGGESPSEYDVYSESDLYDIPVTAMWFSRAGTAAFMNEDKAREMVERYGPQAAVDAYAQNPGEFVRDAAAGVYVNNWLEQNIDSGVTESGANRDKLAALGQKYQDISNRAIELGANPDDIARVTAQKVDKVAGDYQTYYNDTHENTFLKFLLAAGGLMLGAYGLSQVLGAAGTTAAGAGAGATAATTTGTGGGFIGGGYGSVGVSAAPAYAGTAIPTNIFSKATFPGMPVGGGSSTGVAGGGLKFPGSMLPSKVPGATESFASGVGNIKVPVTQGLAPNVGSKVGAGLDAIGKGSVGLQAPSWYLPNTPTGGTSLIDKAKDVLNKADSLSDIVSEDQQQRQQPQGGLRRALTAADLFPQTNIMISPEKWAEMTNPRRTFVGGLGAMKDMT
jgi:hypothetical protein